ncbi:MAG TPA: DnaJ C-terminal domain-containing protein [Deltaproteobacteria bacterium]|nr:DnaJ domain-containing protein [Deltaproteobacteria bacterium]HRW79833.1 DnaJ C-terminal domain-containing protein [Desulfomonilia bacterium]HNQ84950.1 DnaJ C-terminal domain-containing protein [Deltaproteobacteria bacterium]HNS88716.1 DnaJ C-terminal domain-containing protein [Deltaproteobacteria bacterium]HOA43568.1 DnaJ C-terminal domain-containing protein [Deltaproteobacteria bacterium]
MEYKDYYKILGVERGAGQDEIKKRYRKLARDCHPDTCKDDPSAEKRFKELNEAYEVLRDPEKRKRYDALGSNWQEGQSFRPPPGFENIFGDEFLRGRGAHPGGRTFSFEFGPTARGGAGGFSDFFESLFGDLGMGRRSDQRASSPRGGDLESEITITLQDAHRGGTKEIIVQGPGGDKRLNVKIPQGAHDGMKVRLAGQGNQGPGGAGDLYLKMKLSQDERYKLEGNDIVVDIPLTPWDAALGMTSEIETLDGKLSLKIPPGVSSGQRLRLKGKGLAGKGDLFAQIRIVVPKKLSNEEKRLFTELKKVSAFKAQ